MNRMLLPIALAFALLAAACSGDGIGRGERSVGDGPQAAPTVAGQSVDGFAPGIDDRVAIIGVGAGETLPMRAFAGTESPIVAEVPGSATDLFGYGEAWETPDGELWWLIRYDDSQGWIQPGAAYLGTSNDVSAIVAGSLSNSTYGSIEELVNEAASRFDNPIIVSTSAPNAERETTSIVDSLTSGSQINAGERLVLTTLESQGAYRLTAAELIQLCARGTDDAGACS